MKDKSEITGIFIICKSCKSPLLICRSCYRGHRYCNNACRDLGYKERRKAAMARYSASPEAKLDHRDRNRAYRQRRKFYGITQEKTTTNQFEKNVMDKGSPKSLQHIYSRSQLTKSGYERCQICGRELKDPYTGEYRENLELFTFIPNRWRRETD